MKKIVFAVLMVTAVCCQSLHAQTPYYDGLFLRQAYDTSDKKVRMTAEVQTMLVNYFPGSNPNDIGLNLLNKNPFFKDMFKVVTASNLQDPTFSARGFLGNLGNVDVTSIADGLAKFLVERAKEELSLAFFEKFKADMEKDEYKDLRILFPHTYETLKLIDTRIYQYAAYLNELRDAFISDLKDLGYNVPVALQTGTLQGYFQKHPELKTVVSLASQVSVLFIPKDTTLDNLGKYIEKLDPDHFFGAKSRSDSLMNGSIKTLQLLSGSFRSSTPGRYWVPVDSLLSFVKDPLTLKLYLGLMYEKGKSIQLDGKTSLQILMDDMAAHYTDRIQPFSDGIRTFASVIGTYDDYVKYLKTQRNKDTSAAFYYTIYSKTIDAISSGLGIVKVFNPAFAPEFTKFLPAVKTVSDIYINAEQNRFSLTVLSVVKLFKELQGAGVNSKLLEKLTTYASFTAEVAQAKNSNEVKDIISQTVLPVGSASIKKNSRFNIAINAYLGGFYGSEKISDNTFKPWAKSAGVSAPIGVTFSWPIAFGKTTYGSISAFGSLFDLGAIASFRLKDTSTEKLPKLTLQNIFAPGVGIVFGVPKWPISIGYLYQWGPQLREITATTADVKQGALNRRSIVFLAVDIPLLNIFNKPR